MLGAPIFGNSLIIEQEPFRVIDADQSRDLCGADVPLRSVHRPPKEKKNPGFRVQGLALKLQ